MQAGVRVQLTRAILVATWSSIAIWAPAAAEAGLQGADASPSSAPARSSTPTPTGSPQPNPCTAVSQIRLKPTASPPAATPTPLVPDITLCLAYRNDPGIAFAPPSPSPTAPPPPTTSSQPPRVVFDTGGADGKVAADGLVFDVAFGTRGKASSRYINGVPLDKDDWRVLVRIAALDANRKLVRRSTLYVQMNTNGACIEQSLLLTDDLLGACEVAPYTTDDFQAKLTIPWSALNELFARPEPGPLGSAYLTEGDKTLDGVRGPVTYQICAYEGKRDDVAAAFSEESDGARCVEKIVVVREKTNAELAAQAGNESGSGTDQGTSGSSEPSSLRRRPASGSPAAAAATTADAARFVGTAAQPINAYLRLSTEADWTSAFLPQLSKQTNTTLESVVAQQAGTLVPGGIGSSTSSSQFTKIDSDTISRIVPSAFRGYSDPTTSLKNQPQAFDGTDVLELVPFNPTLVNAVTVGAKLATVEPVPLFAPRLGEGGIAWFHDSTRGASATILHLDQDIAAGLAIGVSQVFANSQTAPTNLYVAYPNPADHAYPVSSPAPNPILHSSNTVFGSLFKFGGGPSEEAKPIQIYTQVATNGLGRDWLSAISSAPIGLGPVIHPDGTSSEVALLAGYRAIDYDYDPLFTTYDPFAGNQIYFGRLNYGVTTPRGTPTSGIADRSAASTYSLSVSGIYAENGGVRAYSSIGVSPSIPLPSNDSNKVGFSLTGSYLHSYISSTVYGRESGSFVIPPGPLDLLDNDNAQLSFQAATPDSLLKRLGQDLTATAGVSVLHSPSCSLAKKTTVPTCSSAFTRKVVWTLNAGDRSGVLYLDSEPGTSRTNPTSISPSIPSSSIVTTGLVAYHFCDHSAPDAWGVEPSLTYKNNIAQDGSVFVPGTLLEFGFDVGPPQGIKALFSTVVSVSYQNAVNAHGASVALKNNGFGVQLISASQAVWAAHKSKGDECLGAAGGATKS